MNNARRILGIDPGSRVTGVGILEARHRQQPHCLMGGAIRLTDTDLSSRLGCLYEEVFALVQEYRPTEIAIEQAFVHKNARSALLLGQARGAIIAAVRTQKLSVYEYAPRKVKQAVVGHGAADKTQVQQMIQVLLKLNAKPQADAADALAVALCHLNTTIWDEK
jgi:crossover junction endodeoxyribonuclease RuvC